MNAPASSPLTYPWDRQTPATGEMLSLFAGLHWVRMPMPFALNHINLWVLEDELDSTPTWMVVDAGVATETIRSAWQTLWRAPLAARPLGRMLVTHMHPDHVGNAQWLIERYSAQGAPARLWMSQSDYQGARLALQSTTGFGGERAAAHFQAHGLSSPEDLAKVRARGDYFSSLVPEMPLAYRRLMDGMTLRIGTRDWRCIAGYGHSPEHIALFCEQDGLLISGDMLLPTISTNVSVTDLEPEGDALGLFLASIERMRDLPADTLSLPSHGLPFRGIHARIDQLHAHHAERLAEVEAACRAKPSTAAEMLPVLFHRQLDLHQTTFAMGEAVAHLNHLWHQGVLRREQDASGVWRYGTH